jgi:hypothetical protein
VPKPEQNADKGKENDQTLDTGDLLIESLVTGTNRP